MIYFCPACAEKEGAPAQAEVKEAA